MFLWFVSCGFVAGAWVMSVMNSCRISDDFWWCLACCPNGKSTTWEEPLEEYGSFAWVHLAKPSVYILHVLKYLGHLRVSDYLFVPCHQFRRDSVAAVGYAVMHMFVWCWLLFVPCFHFKKFWVDNWSLPSCRTFSWPTSWRKGKPPFLVVDQPQVLAPQTAGGTTAIYTTCRSYRSKV